MLVKIAEIPSAQKAPLPALRMPGAGRKITFAAGRRKNEKNEEDVDYDPLQRYPDIILKTALVKKKAS